MAPTSNNAGDFAKSQLLKFGWTEGKGLGKNEDGINKPIRASMKFNKTGIGHDAGEEYRSEWWNDVYNSVLNSIQVENGEDNCELRKIDDAEKSSPSVDIPKKEYGFFVKGATIFTDNKNDEETSVKPTKLSDEALFKKCQGLTGHKAARHGCRLSGKLRRLEEQEKSAIANDKKKCKLNINNKDGASKSDL